MKWFRFTVLPIDSSDTLYHMLKGKHPRLAFAVQAETEEEAREYMRDLVCYAEEINKPDFYNDIVEPCE